MNEKELNKILVDSKAESLIKNYETPFFIFFPKIMKKKIDQLNISLKKNYPNSQITYSVKTNYKNYIKMVSQDKKFKINRLIKIYKNKVEIKDEIKSEHNHSIFLKVCAIKQRS